MWYCSKEMPSPPKYVQQSSLGKLAEVQKREFKSQRKIQRHDQRDGKMHTNVRIVLLTELMERECSFYHVYQSQ